MNARRHREDELVPYRAMDADSIRPLLVLAPHPDDEVFGCGGLLALAIDRQVPARVVVVSDGGQGGEPAVREAESLTAAAVLAGARAAPTIDFWRLPDREVRADAALRERIERAMRSSAAEWLVAPSPFEVHPDHRAVCRAAVELLRERLVAGATAPRLVFCEIGQPLIPNTLFDITPVAERKAAAMRCFTSQLAQQAYDQQVGGLNRYRSYTLGSTVTHAEAYWFVEPEAVRGGWAALPGVIVERLRRHD